MEMNPKTLMWVVEEALIFKCFEVFPQLFIQIDNTPEAVQFHQSLYSPKGSHGFGADRFDRRSSSQSMATGWKGLRG
jgi:hypothetical protein